MNAMYGNGDVHSGGNRHPLDDRRLDTFARSERGDRWVAPKRFVIDGVKIFQLEYNFVGKYLE